jgi:F420-dependent oxidoreductase-like protein
MATGTAAAGVAIQAFDGRQFVDQIRQAEDAGIDTAWTTIGGAGGADPLTAFGAAAVETSRIRLGTAIIPTWPRHALTIGQQALALHHLAPGRLRLGIGPSHEPMMTGTFGVQWDRPLLNLREYLVVLRSLFDTGMVEFEGEHVTARAQWREPAAVELLASALRPRSFALCGELADGAISWMCPVSYLAEQALPALRRGAEAVGREAPPLIAHVPVAVADRERAHALAQEQLARYRQVPFYRAMFELAGHGSVDEGYPPALLDDLVASGNEDDVAAGMRRYLEAGCSEVLAMPLIDPDDREGSIADAFAAVGRLQAELARG